MMAKDGKRHPRFIILGVVLGVAALDRKERRVGKECRCRWSPYH